MFGAAQDTLSGRAYSSEGLGGSLWWQEKGPGRRQRIGPPFHRAHAAAQHGLIWACSGMLRAAQDTLSGQAYSSEGLGGSLWWQEKGPGRRQRIGPPFHRAHAAAQHGLIWACSGMFRAAQDTLSGQAYSSEGLGGSLWWQEKGPGRRQRIGPPFHRAHAASQHGLIWACLGMFGAAQDTLSGRAYSSEGLGGSLWWQEKGPGRRQRIGPPFHRAHAAAQHGLIWACSGMFGAAQDTLSGRAYSSEGLGGSLWWQEKGPGRRQRIGPPFHRAHAASQHGLIWACSGLTLKQTHVLGVYKQHAQATLIPCMG